MTRRRLARVLGAAVPVALLAAACTGSPDEPAPSGPTPDGQVATAFCAGTLAGPAVVELLGPGRIRETGFPPVPEPGKLISQCALGTGRRTLTLATAAGEATGRVTLQGIADNTPATAVPIAADGTGLLDPGFGWLARPCTEGRTLLTSLRLQSTADPATPPATSAGQRATLARLVLAAAGSAATAAGCDQGSTPAFRPVPEPPAPAPVTGAACGAPATAVMPVTGPVAGWTATAPATAATAPARACDLTGPGAARVRFVVSRGVVATNAGRLAVSGDTPVPGLPAGAVAGPAGARFDGTCGDGPIAYRLRLTELPVATPTTAVGALFTALVRAAAATAGCPIR